MASRSQITLLCVASIGFAGVSGAHQGAMSKGPKSTKGFMYAKVGKLIQTKCASCHNAKNHPEKVDLSSFPALMKSGEKGPIVVPGHPEKSKLISYVDGTKQPRMPFKQAPLAAADIQLLKKWIADGAKSP